MDHNIHTFIQLIIVGGYLTLMLYSYFRKRYYMSISQKILMPLVMTGFILINSMVFTKINFQGVTIFSTLLYVTQIMVQLLLAFSFNQREKKIDEINGLVLSLEVFKKVADNSEKAICVVDYNSHIMLYSNPVYNEKYTDYIGDKLENNWAKEKVDLFLRNNYLAKEANGDVIIFKEPTVNNKIEEFKKFFSIVDNKEAIIVMEN